VIDHRQEALNMVLDPEGPDYNPMEALVHAVLHVADRLDTILSLAIEVAEEN
jgi:hypothetical protein